MILAGEGHIAKLVFPQKVQLFPALYGDRNFIAVLIRSLHLPLS